ncbi:MAG: flagellar hook-length control protein FliK [Candidatus Methylomirabilis oxygeniifera]|uniref:Flagellar hook-length control protein-like C-terminal domain-containing protein n=1 Tax=Methylomirabilis oxygeniifera TaxID=671143 RepID=D5MGC7_METO1|nr:MAG: flagellar hook-length control protein FliK [Candidatus Methylomirabilis oxyfera]CBE68808.1 protein of unknown function [Candidatus Methylomirabilis oxyfera]
MIPLQVADAAVVSAPQGIPAGTVCSQGTADFLLLFERAMGIGGSTGFNDVSVAESPIGIGDAPIGGESPIVSQFPSDGSGEKGDAQPRIDPAMAMLMATLSQSTQSASLEPSPGLDRVADLVSPTMADAPAAATFLGMSTQPLFTREAGSMIEPAGIGAGGPLATAQPTGSVGLIPVTIKPRLQPEAIRQEAGASVVALEPTIVPQRPRNTTPSADVEIHTVYGDGAPAGVHVEDKDSRVADVIASDQRERGNLSALEGAKNGGIASVAALPRNDGGNGDIVINNPRLAEQPAGPLRSAQEVVPIDRAAIRSDFDRVADAARLADTAARIPVEIEPHLAPSVVSQGTGASAVTPRTTIPQQGLRATAPIADTEIRFAYADSAPMGIQVEGRDSRVAGVMASDQRERGNLSVLEGATNGEIASIAALSRHDGGEGDIRSDDPRLTRRTFPAATSAREVQDRISRVGGGQVTERIADPSRWVASVEGQAEAAGTSSQKIPDRLVFPPRPTVGIGMWSDRAEAPGSELFEGAVLVERVQAGQTDRGRVALPQESVSVETTQDMQQDRSASDPDSGRPSPDRSSPSFGDERQHLSDSALTAAPRGEQLRSESAAPPLRPRALIDQVAEQIVATVRMSPRKEGEYVHLRLHPQTLGELVIEVSWKDSGIVAAIKAQHHVAGELLANDLDRLRTALVEQGIPISDLGVQVELDLRQWSYAGNGSQDPRAIGYHPEVMLRHDRGSMPPMVPVMGPDSLIDITV